MAEQLAEKHEATDAGIYLGNRVKLNTESKETLHSEIESLRRELSDLKREKADLELIIADLRRELANLKSEKADLELIMETSTEHSDDVLEYLFRKVEATVRESEKRFRLISETIPVPIFVTRESDGMIQYANDPAAELIGLPVESLLQRSTREFYHNISEWKELLNLLSEKGSVENYEMRLKKADGSEFWAALYVQPLTFNDGPCLMSVLHDLTERKQAEEERLRLATAVEHAAEGIVIVETDGTVRYVNPAFESVSGYSREEIDGQNFRVLDRTEYSEEFYQSLWQTLSSGQVWSGHIVNKKKNGKTCELKTTISPIRNRSDEIISFVAMIRDVTHEVRMEKQIRQSQKMEAIGTLAGGIAHDFNNILSAIMGYTELSLNELPQDSMIRNRMEKVMKACRRAADLVKQILAFSRRSEKEMKPVSMVSIADETVRLLRASLPATIEIRRKFTSRSGMILGDPTQIHQVLMNLCTNAAHAMEERGGILGVSLTDVKNDSSGRFRYKNLAPGPYVKLTVTDTGHGMDRAVMERIFEPFFTTKGSGKGTGMGLAVTHGIVEAHKGMISVYSEPGKGTTFHVLFPELTASDWVSGGTEPVADADDEIPTGTERILFVDDEESLTESGQELLESLGYSVISATKSLEALELFTNNPDAFDLVITDQTMPGMTGMELSEKLLAVRPDIPIILCSGFSEAITPEKLRTIGIRAIMTKPFVKRDMAQCIRNVLRSEK